MSKFEEENKLNQALIIARIIEAAFEGVDKAIEQIGEIESVNDFEITDSDLIKKKNLLFKIKNMSNNL